MRQVQKITVVNRGAYVFNFAVQWLSADGNWHTTGMCSRGQCGQTPGLQHAVEETTCTTAGKLLI